MTESRPGAIIPFEDIRAQREAYRAEGRRVVATNGCFDLLHVGHLRYLAAARALGGLLWVGVNDDAGVSELKGPNRPVNPAAERAELLAALRVVDAVTVFPGPQALDFLVTVQPDIYAKGGDYTLETLVREEREALQTAGIRIELLALVPGRSTTDTIQRMQAPSL